MLLGWATNCLPLAFPARFARVVAAYSAGDKDLIAASGKYRSPVLEDGLPDLVVQRCWVQSLSDCCGAFNPYTPRLYSCTASQEAVLFSRTTGLPQSLALLDP